MVKRRILLSDFFHIRITNRLNNHLSTDKDKQYECDPMIDRCNILLETDTQKPSDQRHQCLKAAKVQTYDKSLLFIDFLHRQPLTDRYRKCIHRKSDSNQK